MTADASDPVLPRREPDDSIKSNPLAVSGPPESLTTAPLTAIIDPNLLPTTGDKPASRRVRSLVFLALLLAVAVSGAWFVGLDILQGDDMLKVGLKGIGVWMMGLGGVAMTGGLDVDWFELVLGWWWVATPIVGAASVLFVVVQERATGIEVIT